MDAAGTIEGCNRCYEHEYDECDECGPRAKVDNGLQESLDRCVDANINHLQRVSVGVTSTLSRASIGSGHMRKTSTGFSGTTEKMSQRCLLLLSILLFFNAD